MFFRSIDNMSNCTFAKVKWLLTMISGALTTSMIFVLESAI